MSGKLLINENPLIVLPSLVVRMDGNVTKAMLLQQIHFLLLQPRSGIDHDCHHWIWKTAGEWVEDGFTWLTPGSIAKALRELEDDGYIFSTSRIRDRWDSTKYYRLSPMLLESHSDVDSSTHPNVDSNPLSEVDSSHSLYTETTTETTNRDYKHLPTLDDTPVQPISPQQQVGRSTGPPTPVGLLTDSFVDLQLSQARKYQHIDPELVARHVLEWERDMRSGKVNHVGALVARLNKADSWRVPELSHDDRTHPYYVRHFGQYDFRDAESRANRDYMPATTETEDASRMEYAA